MSSINWFFFSSLSLSITSLFLIIVLLIFGKEKVHKMWLFFNVALFIWGTSATLSSIIPFSHINLVDFCWRIGCLAVTFTSPAISHIAFYLSKRNLKKFTLVAYAQAFIFGILIVSTNLVFRIADIPFQGKILVNMGPLYFYWFLAWFITCLYTHLVLINSYLIDKNSGIQYFQIPLLISFLIGSLNFLIPLRFSIFQIGNFGCTLYCLLVTYFIFRHHLIGMQIIYKRGLFYSILITLLMVTYLSLVILTEWLFKGLFGYKSIIVSLFFSTIIAILFNPIRERVQKFVDRIFLGKTPQEIANENNLLKQELEHSERLKTASALALGLAHEIKNPITTIKTFAEYLPEKLDDKDFLKKFSRLIPAETERINNIIQQLLRFSKPSAPKFQQTYIEQIIRETLAFLNSEFLKRRIELSEIYEDENNTIHADPEQIKQVFLNIIFNAMEAMPRGGTIVIEIKLLDNYFLEISIKDNGSGISKDDLPHIFDPFFSKKESGTGLGLAITHQIVKNHNGKIEVQSKINNGTIVKLQFPIYQCK
jgi:signal transduction histidine kinase